MDDEAERVKQARAAKEVESLMSKPAFLANLDIDARYRFAKFTAFVRAGFTEAQALELCKT